MSRIHENALIILRTLEEYGIVSSSRQASVPELKTLVGLDDEEFMPAYDYLLQSGLIIGAGGDDVGKRWMTRQGIDYLRREMNGRLHLTLERV